jgi:hypothetical protein
MILLALLDALARVEHPTSNAFEIKRLSLCAVCAMDALVCGVFAIGYFRQRKPVVALIFAAVALGGIAGLYIFYGWIGG